MKGRYLIALFGILVVLVGLNNTAQAAPGGNRAAAHACQQDGYRSMVGTSGGFANVGECSSYAAIGGEFVSPGAGEFLVPAGQVARLSDIRLSSCNALTFGYDLNTGERTSLGSKAAGCATVSRPDGTIGPFPTAVIVRIVLTDETCGQTFDSAGGHARVAGSNPYDVDIVDAGFFCEAPEGTTRVPGINGNLSTTLTVGGWG